MPQPIKLYKSKYASLLVAVSLGLTACETIDTQEVHEAKKTSSGELPPAPKKLDPEIFVAENDHKTVPRAPEASSQAYASGYEDAWKESQSVQELIIAELTREQGEHDEQHGKSTFAGETHSIVRPDHKQAGHNTKHQSGAKNSQHHSTGMFGIHLASYRQPANAPKGWAVLLKSHQEVLSHVSPKLKEVSIPGKGEYLRLIAGPYHSADEAQKACVKVKSQGTYCTVMAYEGQAI